MKRYFLLFTLLFSISISFISCQKKKEEKILGSWQVVFLTNVSNKTLTWTFTENNKFIREIKSDTLIYDTAEWSITAKALTPTTLRILNFNNDTNGTYEVLTLNKKYLIIQRIMRDDGNSDGAFNRIEFVKAN